MPQSKDARIPLKAHLKIGIHSIVLLLVLFLCLNPTANAKLKVRDDEPEETQVKPKPERKVKRKRKPRKRRYKKRTRRKRRPPKRQKKKEEEVVDLDNLTASSESESSQSGGRPTGGSGTIFKAYFDLLLTLRPGVSPLTFDSFHSLLLFDIIPSPKVRFSAEIPFGTGRPSPRFFEFDYNLTERLQFRIGKIWIPFDDSDPHVTFGGIMNTTELQGPGQVSFLPDIWADLGIGVMFKPVDTTTLTIETHAYVVNGFRDGGTDPVDPSNPSYPDFSNPPNAEDNNSDKALGFRGHALIAKMIGVGISFYSGRYSDRTLTSGRLLMLGTDLQLRFSSGTQFKLGYVYMAVGVPFASDPDRKTFMRGGAYAEFSQRFFKKFRLTARGGIQQNDSRVTDVNDRHIVGLRASYDFSPIMQLSLERHQDLKNVLGKKNREYTAARFVIKL